MEKNRDEHPRSNLRELSKNFLLENIEFFVANPYLVSGIKKSGSGI
jgi:hypothetical protein